MFLQDSLGGPLEVGFRVGHEVPDHGRGQVRRRYD
jgi:hypothetical protein